MINLSVISTCSSSLLLTHSFHYLYYHNSVILTLNAIEDEEIDSGKAESSFVILLAIIEEHERLLQAEKRPQIYQSPYPYEQKEVIFDQFDPEFIRRQMR